ncbi:MAG: MFS transporter [Hyphomicrobiaceae bacterium]
MTPFFAAPTPKVQVKHRVPDAPPVIVDETLAVLPLLLLISSVQAMATSSLLAVAALGPRIASANSVPASWVGFEVALSYALAAIGSLVAGPFIARTGATLALIIACSTSALALALAGLGTLREIVLAAILLGAAYSIVGPAASQLLAKVAPPGRQHLMFSIRMTGIPLGAALSMLLLPSLAEMTGWRTALLIAGAPQLLLAFVLVRRRGDLDDGQPTTSSSSDPLASLRLLVSHSGIRSIALMSFFYSGFAHTFTSCLLTALVTDLDWTLRSAGAFSFVMIGIGAVARLAMGWAADKLVTPCTLFVSVGLVDLIGGSWLASVTPATSLWLLAAMLALLGAFGSGWAGIQQSEAARMSPSGMVSSGAGAVYFGTFVGGMVMPAVFTAVRDLTGRSLLAIGIVGCLAITGSILIAIGYRARAQAVQLARS